MTFESSVLSHSLEILFSYNPVIYASKLIYKATAFSSTKERVGLLFNSIILIVGVAAITATLPLTESHKIIIVTSAFFLAIPLSSVIYGLVKKNLRICN